MLFHSELGVWYLDVELVALLPFPALSLKVLPADVNFLTFFQTMETQCRSEHVGCLGFF